MTSFGTRAREKGYRIDDTNLRSAAKAAISKFPADQLIRNRQAAVNAIMDGMTAALEAFPVTVDSPQIENLSLPPTHLETVQEKERAPENSEREKHKPSRDATCRAGKCRISRTGSRRSGMSVTVVQLRTEPSRQRRANAPFPAP